MRWHYSKIMPKAKSIFVGVWENETFIGALIFGLGGGNATDGRRYGLTRSFQVAELERIALTKHQTPVSRIVKIAMLLLKKQSPGIQMCVSYADPKQGHHGGIYQAGGWIYVGQTAQDRALQDAEGKLWHTRTFSDSGYKVQFGRRIKVKTAKDGVIIKIPGKHKYLYPLEINLREQLEKLRQSYPKRAGSDTVDTSGFHPEKGGLAPTPALHP